ncbi:transcriptional regulator [Streptomyces sp. NPDC088354]|uniref:transcriptional regulator n=1 Tax=unclassified Streptomyces TaxID=2593676 RepID=UPI0029B9F24C|nr:transcriptional regulator [Streptomyces sp. MI02-7b]MDX3072633.1 transcriptional regulator [Streptomyces sp. MI02-7b]
MGWWLVNTETLVGSRFVVSPLAEAVASLKLLDRGTPAHPGERAWLDAHLPAYRERLAGDPVTALLVRTALGRAWNADFLTPTPAGEGNPGFEEELSRIRDTPPDLALAHLAVSADGPLPPSLRRPDLPERAAEIVTWVWTRSVLPDWQRRRRVIEADIVARTAQLSRGGWAAALDEIRPGMRWLGDGRLQVNTRDYPPRDLSGARLMFVPVTPAAGWVSWDEPRRYAVVYPCSGALAEAGRRPRVPEALGALLGPGRAAVLVLLGTPKSTTQLVALTGQGLGSVGRHLKVLLDARLVRRRRAGRSVLYYRTETGDALVVAQQDG